MKRSIALRVLLACLFALATFGEALAQPLSCTGDMPTPRINVLAQIYVNRDTPVGPLAGSPPQVHAGASVMCTGGAVGTPIEVALRVHPSLQAGPSPWGAGLLLETTVPGIGIELQTPSPMMMTSDFQVVHTTTRNGLPTQLLPSVTMRVQIARHSQIDVLDNHALHGIPLLQMAWRAPGVQDEWQWVTTWSLNALTPGMRNIISETCFIGPDPTVPYARTVQLGSVGAGDFPGIGQEAPGRNVAGTLEVTCRNYAGGRMKVESTHRHATMPGVLLNQLETSDAAQGVGIRVRHGAGGAEWDFNAPWVISPQGFRVNDIMYFNYNVRYVQTEPIVRSGRFKATVTFTVQYD